MSTYTDLSTSCDSGDPVTTTLMAGLRDNPEAIANGNAGAAADIYIETAGIRDAAVTVGEGEKLEPATSTDGVDSLIVGRRRAISNTSVAQTSPAQHINRAGSYVIRLNHTNTTPAKSSFGRLLVNGATVFSSSATTTSTSDYHQLTLSPGDYWQVQCIYNSGSSVGLMTSDAYIMCDNPLSDARPDGIPTNNGGTLSLEF